MATIATEPGARWFARSGQALARWRYQAAAGRDARLDLLRGCFVVAMLVDHLGGSSWLHLITGGNRFFVSAAEGFVFLSGLVMGLVYAKLIARDGPWPATHRALRRAAVLYAWAVLLGVGFQLISDWAGASWAEPMPDVGGYLIGIATLQRSTYLADVLMLYALLVLLAPAALALLARGRAAVVLAISGGVWAAHQIGLTAPIDRAVPGLDWFTPLAWQVVFFVGLVLGYHWRGLRAWAGGRRWALPLAGLALAAAGLILLSIWAPGSAVAGPVADFFLKDGLHTGRLVAAAVFFPLLFGVATVAWRPLQASLGWLLIPLGQQALLAYTLHLGLALTANIWWPRIPGYSMDDPAANTLAQVLAILLLWALIQAAPRLGRLARRLTPRQPAQAAPRWIARTRNAGLATALAGLLVIASQPLAASAPGRSLASEAALALAVPSMLAPASDKGLPARVAPAGPTPLAEQAAPAGPTPIARRAAPGAPTPIARRDAPTGPVDPVSPPAAVGGAAVAPGALPAAANAPAANDDGPARPRPRAILAGQPTEETFFSPALGREMPFLIQLPADYYDTHDRYPVLYLLHGLGGDRREWATYGVFRDALEMTAKGDLPPMLIVLPEGEQSYWVNHVDGPRWGDYIADDLVNYVDTTFRTRAEASQRAIGGLSMGGVGALTLSLTYPDRFGVVGVHSPSPRPEDQAMPFFGTGAAFRERDPIALIEDGRRPGNVRLWLDVGDQDWWLPSVMQLRAALDARGIAFTWRLWNGVHDSPYWIEHVDDYLRFYGDALARPTP